MTMATIQFYKNKYRYPHYSEVITAAAPPMDCTPVGINLKSGTLRVKGSMEDFMNCNYMKLTRGGHILYAWITDVQFHTAESFLVSYSVDAWRTYKDKINLGTQYIARRPQSSKLYDKLLGSSTNYPIVDSLMHQIGNPAQRVFVVQTRTTTDEIFSRTPVQPNPYTFYFRAYDVNNWTSDTVLQNLMASLINSAEPTNIVTMYSIPYMDLSSLGNRELPVKNASETVLVSGFKSLGSEDPSQLLTISTKLSIPANIDEILRTNHSIQVVIPEAGIIQVPDELLTKPGGVYLQQDVDLFSGACNYMLTADGAMPFTQSARGSSISSIPIVSDPLDTYLSQNQNALATSLMGDVASIAGGVVLGLGMGGAVGAGLGGMAAAIGGGSVVSGINGIVGRHSAQADIANKFSNPPAFLGTALASKYNQLFWLVAAYTNIENADAVHTNFGYPWGMVDSLVFPGAGFIQTEGCNVSSTDGTVPAWALEEINSNFNNGILVH